MATKGIVPRSGTFGERTTRTIRAMESTGTALLLLLLSVEHHLCIGDLSSERNQGKHKRERKTKKTNLIKLSMP